MMHDMQEHYQYVNTKLTEEEVPHWERISEEHASRIRELEDATLSKRERMGNSFYTFEYVCTWCGMCGNEREVRFHVESK